MDQIVKLTEQRIEGNIKEITLLKIKQDSLISELSDTYRQIKSIQQDNNVLEKQLIDYVNGRPNTQMAGRCDDIKSVRDTSNGERFTHGQWDQPNIARKSD